MIQKEREQEDVQFNDEEAFTTLWHKKEIISSSSTIVEKHAIASRIKKDMIYEENPENTLYFVHSLCLITRLNYENNFHKFRDILLINNVFSLILKNK